MARKTGREVGLDATFVSRFRAAASIVVVLSVAGCSSSPGGGGAGGTGGVGSGSGGVAGAAGRGGTGGGVAGGGFWWWRIGRRWCCWHWRRRLGRRRCCWHWRRRLGRRWRRWWRLWWWRHRRRRYRRYSGAWGRRRRRCGRRRRSRCGHLRRGEPGQLPYAHVPYPTPDGSAPCIPAATSCVSEERCGAGHVVTTRFSSHDARSCSYDGTGALVAMTLCGVDFVPGTLWAPCQQPACVPFCSPFSGTGTRCISAGVALNCATDAGVD